jgi:hypothetical protein
VEAAFTSIPPAPRDLLLLQGYPGIYIIDVCELQPFARDERLQLA